MPSGIDSYCVSSLDIRTATDNEWGVYRIRSVLRDLPATDGPKSNGRSFKLFKLSDVLPRLRAKKQWSDQFEAQLLNIISSKGIENV